MYRLIFLMSSSLLNHVFCYIGLLSVLSVCLFVCLFMCYTFSCSYLAAGEEDEMKFHGGTKNLNSTTAKYRINDITQ